MEVTVTKVEGLSDDCYISIGVQREWHLRHVASEKPRNFKESFDDPGIIKLDILTKVGSARIVRQPGAMNYEVSVPCLGGQKADLQLAVSRASKAATDDKKDVPVRKVAPASHQAAIDAQKYLDGHKLTEFLQVLVKGLLELKPSDPYAWISSQFLNARDRHGTKAELATVRRFPQTVGGACVVTGPSGVGKSTLIKKLMSDFPGKFGFSISHTTRDPRPGEQNNVDYHFVSKQKMEEDIKAGLFIEHAEVHGNFYGTSIAAVQSVMSKGMVCLLDIDVQGADAVRNSSLASSTSFVFFAPPSMEILEQRLRGRGTESEEKVQKRLAGAVREMAVYEATPEVWDLTLKWTNPDVDLAYAEFRSFLEKQLPPKTEIAIVRQLPSTPGGACVVTGPSGVGKSTLIKKLMADFPGKFGFCTSHTTRDPRPGEQNGVDYHFVSKAQMEKDIKAGLFIEYAEVHGNFYGTSIAAVKSVMDNGMVCLLDIDVQGADSVRRSSLASCTTFVFFAPPNMGVLEQRLRGRGTETEEKVQKRLAGAVKEMGVYEAKPEAWDLTLKWTNPEVDLAYAEFRRFLENKLHPEIAIVRQRPKPTGGACVVTGPSGVGKSTLIKKLMADFPGKFGFSISHTTREPRAGEQNGVDYHFVSKDQMQNDIKAGLFIEHAEVHGNFYGTSIAAVESVMAKGMVCLLDIDVQGADSVRRSSLAPCTTFVFFSPPNMGVLEQRLRGRGTETEDKVQKRLAGAVKEMAVYEAQPEAWDLTLKWTNPQVELAYIEFRRFLERKLIPEIATVRKVPKVPGGACVVTGPSGVGKSTLIKKLMADFPGKFGFSISHTTREPRAGERNGVDYHFVSKDQMQKDIKAGLFIEHAEVHGNFYGTSVAAVESVMKQGVVCLLDIDVQGADSVRKSPLGSCTSFVFFAPPNLDVLEQRLRGRGTETEEKVQKRLAGALKEMDVYETMPEAWDLTLQWTNPEVDLAYAEFRSFLLNQLPRNQGHTMSTSALIGSGFYETGLRPNLGCI